MMIVLLSLALNYLICVALASPAVHGPEYLDMLRATGQDAEFARLLKIDDVALVRSDEEMSEMTSKASHLGDILLTQEQLEESRQTIKFTRYPGSKWRNNVIPYWVSREDYTTSERNHIESAINTLNGKIKLELRPWRSGDNDYVMVFSGRGCYANLGRVGGEQSISIQKNGCMRVGTIQHEFIHAAGILHEHMRPDRDNHITIRPENIPDEWKSQYDKASSNDFDSRGPYDHYSVMHYPVPAPGTGRPAFDVKDKSIDTRRIGQREGPTQNDINKVNSLYA